MLELYFIIVNVLAFGLCGIDKRRAKRQEWRVKERTFIFLITIGGAIGFYFGMIIFRHKTRKPLFRFGVPLMIITQVTIFLCYVLDIL